jgi:hypothetical protein
LTSYVSVDLRRLVAQRAGWMCEYCLIAEEDTYLGCQVDHIISEKHGGPTLAENLAWACVFCNRGKGADLASLTASGRLERFFNPRQDRWAEHFHLQDARIEAASPIGEVTIKVLQFNSPERILERAVLMDLGLYPSEPARRQTT